MANMATDEAPVTQLVTERDQTSKGKSKKSNNRSIGDQAFLDAMLIIGGAWLVLIFLVYTLRAHNI